MPLPRRMMSLTMNKKIKNYIIYLCITFGCVLADFVTKQLAVKFLSDGKTVRAIPYLFNLVYVENKGAAWGMFADKRWVFMTVSAVAIVALAIVQYKFSHAPKIFCIPLAMLIGGGVGNMIDRISLGYVVDFLQFDFWKSFPVFNIADSFVTVCSVILGIYLIFFDKTVLVDKKKETVNDESDGN